MREPNLDKTTNLSVFVLLDKKITNINSTNNINTNNKTSTQNMKNQLLASLMENSKEINYQPFISIELINFILAFLSLTLNYSSCLWFINKTYAFFFSFHLVFKSIVCILLYSSFEILYKFQSCFRKNNFQFLNLSLIHI